MERPYFLVPPSLISDDVWFFLPPVRCSNIIPHDRLRSIKRDRTKFLRSEDELMSESRKEKIIDSLQQAKQTGQLRTENIRAIVRDAIAQAVGEVKEGRTEIVTLVRDAIAAVTETFQEKSGEIREEVTEAIEGAIDGVSEIRRKAISQTQSEIETLEARVVKDEAELQQEIDGALTTIERESKSGDKSDRVTQAIAESIITIKDSEEFALLQKRYAQLKAQLAVVQANLASRYGEQYEEVNKYLNEAKTWYEKAKEDPEVFTEPAKQKRVEFEQKLGEAGSAVARKEKQIKRILQELWRAMKEIFHEKSAK
jgi:polyhydroxyalkanoate synthesis regulator phasin